MKQTIHFLLISFIIFFVGACSKKEDPVPPEPENKSLLVGRWSYSVTKNYGPENRSYEFIGIEYDFLKDYTYVKYKDGKEVLRNKYVITPISGYGTIIKFLDSGDVFVYKVSDYYKDTFYVLQVYRTSEPKVIDIDLNSITDYYTRPKK